MIETVEAAKGGYRFMPGVSQYSAGVGGAAGIHPGTGAVHQAGADASGV